MMSGGYEADMVQNTPFGAGADEPARKAATKAITDLKNKMPIYAGPLKDNKGNVVISKTYDNLDPFLDQMNYLLDGVQGSIT
jgi:simple sugar transport system substrate-binding protein